MITVFSKPSCPYCVKAKDWLTLHKFDFEMVDVLQHPEALAFIKSQGHTTVPQLYYNGKLLVEGGFTGMQKLGADALRARLV